MPRFNNPYISLPHEKPYIPGPKSAFAHYLHSSKLAFEHGHPGDTPPFALFLETCVTNWRVMSETERAPFLELAIQDRKRYEEQLRSGPASPPPLFKLNFVGSAPKCKYPKPTPPKSAFFWFCQKYRAVVQSEHPRRTFPEVAIELMDRWQKTSMEDKREFEHLADESYAQYEAARKQHSNEEYDCYSSSPSPINVDDDDDED